MIRKTASATSAATAAPTRAKAASAPAKAAPKSSKTALPATRALTAKAAAPKAAKRAPTKTEAAQAPAKATPKASTKAPAKPAAGKTAKAPAKTAAPAVKPGAKAATRGTPKQPVLAVKRAAQAVVKAAAPAARGRGVQKTVEADSARPVLVRDSFTMPDGEYAVLATVKQACLKAGFEVKKSELLRIGVALVGRLDTATLRQVLGSLPQLKTGRPPAQ